MDIILQKNIVGLGKKNELVTVKNGYGRNYLIPQGFAILATAIAKKNLFEDVRQATAKYENVKRRAEDIANKIKKLSIEINAKAGETGKIFGSVTPLQITSALKQQGFQIERDKIKFIEDIKMVGTYNVTINLHKEVQQNLTVNVIAQD